MIYVGIIFIGLFGTLLHFTYEISGHKKWVAIFSAVNESTWEHIKIGMTPTIIWSIYEIIVHGFNGTFIIAKSLSLLTIILLIPILFYTYTAFTKKAILWIDVICFYVSIICSNLVFNYFININNYSSISIILACLLLVVEIIAYLTLSFKPIKCFIFEDPISHKYGLEGHTCHHHEH